MFTPTLSLRALSQAATVFLLLAVVAAGALLSGCDAANDEGEPVAPGTFAASATGAVQANFTGLAAFATDLEDESGAPMFAIGLVTGDSTDAAVLIGRGAPATRTYAFSLEEAGEAGAFYVHGVEGEGGLYFASSGSLTLTSVTADRLRGRFQLTAASLFDETDRVTLSGSFDAPRGEVEPAPMPDPDAH